MFALTSTWCQSFLPPKRDFWLIWLVSIHIPNRHKTRKAIKTFPMNLISYIIASASSRMLVSCAGFFATTHLQEVSWSSSRWRSNCCHCFGASQILCQHGWPPLDFGQPLPLRRLVIQKTTRVLGKKVGLKDIFYYLFIPTSTVIIIAEVENGITWPAATRHLAQQVRSVSSERIVDQRIFK